MQPLPSNMKFGYVDVYLNALHILVWILFSLHPLALIAINSFPFLLYLGRVSQFYLSIVDVTFFILFILLFPVDNSLWF